MPELLEQGPDRPRLLPTLTWRRSRVVDALSAAVVACAGAGALTVGTHPSDDPAASTAVQPTVHGSRPNLDLPAGANLGGVARGRAPRYERTPTAAGLTSAITDLVAQLCDGGALVTVVRQSVSPGFRRAEVSVTTARRGVPTKERDEAGALSVRLSFHRDGYEYAALRRSGSCAG